jgi:glyoxylase-like metal-dependent hydrolase (beta-lactamase superfamily II)
MVTMIQNEDIQIDKLELGPWGTNAYIVVCRKTQESLIVDAPAEARKILDTLEGTHPRYILMTHNHLDHVGALAELQHKLKVPIAAHALDAAGLPVIPQKRLNDGDTLTLGKLRFQVRHTPGHTPGSVCFKVGRYLLAGDTIFPGGPGKTRSPADFKQIIQTITERIFVLPDDTLVYPGHGESTILKKEKLEFAAFQSRPHDPNLCGDVVWLSS